MATFSHNRPGICWWSWKGSRWSSCCGDGIRWHCRWTAPRTSAGPTLRHRRCTPCGNRQRYALHLLIFSHNFQPQSTKKGVNQWLGSLLLYLGYVFWALINSLLCWFCTSTLGLVLFQTYFPSQPKVSFFTAVWWGVTGRGKLKVTPATLTHCTHPIHSSTGSNCTSVQSNGLCCFLLCKSTCMHLVLWICIILCGTLKHYM